MTTFLPSPVLAQPAEYRAAPYAGVVIPWLLGWDIGVARKDAETLEYTMRSKELSANVRMHARRATSEDVAVLAKELRELKGLPVPLGYRRKVYKIDNGFVVLFIGSRDVQARATMLVSDRRGFSYLSLIGKWPVGSQLRMAIVAARFESGVTNK